MHQASDGMLARVRLPGGQLSGAQLAALTEHAANLGDGVLYLTSRANIQLRGMPACTRTLGAKLRAVGLQPSSAHERVRNYLASPASGYFGGHVDVRRMVRALDEAVCARPHLAQLSGRFLFALDDGRGDVVDAGADVCWQALPPEGSDQPGRLVLAGVDSGLRVDSVHAVPVLVRCAEEFAALRAETGCDAWRVRDIPNAPESLLRAVRTAWTTRQAAPEPLGRAEQLPLGVSAQGNGKVSVCAAPPLGELSTAQARLIVNEATEFVVTPWRTVLVPDIAACEAERVADALAGANLAVDPDGSAQGVSACIGMPACAKAHADVRGQARAMLERLPADTVAHLAGCERRCGKPAQSHSDVVALPDGYRVDGAWVPTAALADTLASQGMIHTVAKGLE